MPEATTKSSPAAEAEVAASMAARAARRAEQTAPAETVAVRTVTPAAEAEVPGQVAWRGRTFSVQAGHPAATETAVPAVRVVATAATPGAAAAVEPAQGLGPTALPASGAAGAAVATAGEAVAVIPREGVQAAAPDPPERLTLLRATAAVLPPMAMTARLSLPCTRRV